jgi:hypothetical protein
MRPIARATLFLSLLPSRLPRRPLWPTPGQTVPGQTVPGQPVPGQPASPTRRGWPAAPWPGPRGRAGPSLDRHKGAAADLPSSIRLIASS